MTLKPNEISVFSVNLDTAPSMFDLLNKDEKKHAEQLRIEQVRHRFVASRGYLRQYLSDYLNLPADEIVFSKETFGKPFIKSYPLHFNMAHSHELAVYAFSLNSPLGVDIEKHRSSVEIMDIAKRVMTDHELSFLKKTDDQEALFFELWARKEAIIKATGEGFNTALTSIETLDENGHCLDVVLDNQSNEWFITELQLQGFSGVLASKKKNPIVILTNVRI